MEEIEEQYISQLVSSNENLNKNLPFILKNIWETNKTDSFIKSCKIFAERREKEIENICHAHYEGFSKQISNIPIIRQEVDNLKQQMISLNDSIADGGQLIYDSKREIFEAKKMLINVEKTRKALQDSLNAFNSYNKASLEVSDGLFIQALRTIELLLSTHLRLISEFSFCSKIQSWIVNLLDKIKEAAANQLKGWLSRMREEIEKIGFDTIQRAKQRLELYEQENLIDQIIKSIAQIKLNSVEEEDALSCESIDFKDLLYCLFLFQRMNLFYDFVHIFSESRRKQCENLLSMKPSLSGEKGKGPSLESLINNIVGFFILEYQIYNLPQGFYSKSHCETLWSLTMERLKKMLTDLVESDFASLSSSNISLVNFSVSSVGVDGKMMTMGGGRPLIFSQVKEYLVLLLHSLKFYNFDMDPLVEILMSLFYRYAELLKMEKIRNIKQVIEEEDSLKCLNLGESSLPSSVATYTPSKMKELLPSLRREKRYESLAVENYPFSLSVPRSLEILQSYIDSYCKFLEEIPIESNVNDLYDLLKRTIEMIIIEIKNDYLAIAEKINDIEGYMQIFVNLDWLSRSIIDIEERISETLK